MAKAQSLESLREDSIRTTTRYIRECLSQEAKLDPALSQTRKDRKQLEANLLDLVDKRPDDLIPGMENSIAKPSRPACLQHYAGDIKGWEETKKRPRGRPPKTEDGDDDEGEGDGPPARA